VAQQGSPPGRPPRDYPSLDELSPEDGRPSDHGPAEQGAHHRGRGERPLRARRPERPERQGWEYSDPFAPGADANLPSWAPPSEFPSDRPPAPPRRPGRRRPEDDGGQDDARGYRRQGHRRPDGDSADDRQPGYDQPGYDQPGYDQSGHDQPGYDQSGYDRPGDHPGPETARPGRRRADNSRDLAEPGYQRSERAASHRRPSDGELSQHDQGYAQRAHPDPGYADQGYADSGYAGQGYSDQGYADQGYAERPSGGHHRPDGERPSGGHYRPDGERPSGGHYRPDGERPSGSHRRPDPGALAYQQPATDRPQTNWRDSGEFQRPAPGYERPDYEREPGGDRRPGYGAADDGYNNGAGVSGGHRTVRDPRTGPLAGDSGPLGRAADRADTDTRAADTRAADTDTRAARASARAVGLPGRFSLPGRAGRGRAAAARLRKSRRKVYRWSGVGIAVCVVVALVVVLTHHGPKPLPYVTTLLAGEFKSVPSACNSVSATVLNQYLPGPGRTMANQMSGSTDSECSFTVDRKPVFLELNVTAQAYEPFAPATAAGSKPGSATANAVDNFAEVQQGLAHPAKTAPQSPARILPLTKVGQQGFVAVATQHVTGIESEIVTIVVRDRNVLITVSETGQESGHGFGPVSVGTLEAGAQAAAKDVLAKTQTQPTA
jgi:hypothetical protein